MKDELKDLRFTFIGMRRHGESIRSSLTGQLHPQALLSDEVDRAFSMIGGLFVNGHIRIGIKTTIHNGRPSGGFSVAKCVGQFRNEAHTH